MSLLRRIGRSFVDEFSLQSTQFFLLAAAIFLCGGVLQFQHNWTNSSRPIWVDVMWSFSAIAFVAASSPSRRMSLVSWLRMGLYLLIHTLFLTVYFWLVKSAIHLPQAAKTVLLMCLLAIEAWILIWIARKFPSDMPLTESTESKVR